MDTLKIKAFLCAVKRGSLSGAADEFTYTPSALSHIITSLEGELGVKLLHRTSRGVELSEEGQVLYTKAEALIQAEENLLRAAREICERERKELVIGTYPSISVRILPPLLKKFKEEHSDIKISIKVGNSISTWIDDGTADIIFADDTSFINKAWHPMYEDEFVAAVPKELYAERHEINIEELYENSFIFLQDTHIAKLLDINKFKEIMPVPTGDDATVLSLVNSGVGISVMPRLAAGNAGGEGYEIRTLSLIPRIKRTLGYLYKKPMNTALKAFANFLEREYKQSSSVIRT